MNGAYHGEYKVPGGKLVVADLDVRDGTLGNVQISGDFFLEPDAALDSINAALDGLPAGLDTRGLAARIDARLPAGAVLVGFSAEAVAIAVRRALTRASDWTGPTTSPGTSPGTTDPDTGTTLPGHVLALVRAGVYILESLNLEELAADGVREFSFVCLPLKLRGGTGSPVRPIAY